MASDTTMDLTQRLEELLERRQQHVDAVEEIDKTLGRVRAALGEAGGGENGRRRGRPPGPSNGGKRIRNSYATTGDDSILNFVRENENPTTREIKEHWASEGRRGTADNVLSKLVREKKLKRAPIGVAGERGSRYVEA